LNLQDYIEEVEKLGELKTVRGADWNLEIGAVTDLNAKNVVQLFCSMKSRTIQRGTGS